MTILCSPLNSQSCDKRRTLLGAVGLICALPLMQSRLERLLVFDL
jgi:hypothetical protein